MQKFQKKKKPQHKSFVEKHFFQLMGEILNRINVFLLKQNMADYSFFLDIFIMRRKTI